MMKNYIEDTWEHHSLEDAEPTVKMWIDIDGGSISPSKGYHADMMYDIWARQDQDFYIIHSYNAVLIPTGVYFAPSTTELDVLVRERGSSPISLVLKAGVIDNQYRGEFFIKWFNPTTIPFVLITDELAREIGFIGEDETVENRYYPPVLNRENELSKIKEELGLAYNVDAWDTYSEKQRTEDWYYVKTSGAWLFPMKKAIAQFGIFRKVPHKIEYVTRGEFDEYTNTSRGDNKLGSSDNKR